jgi:NADPH:quinone reductase
VRAVVMRQTGGPEVLAVEEVPVPEPGPGQVLVRVGAIGVSTGEAKMRAGEYPVTPPMIMGAEAAGTIEQVGAGVDPALTGTRVAAITGGRGSYAEYVAVDLAKTAAIPDGLSTEDAVASAAAGALSLALLHRAQLQDNETVLIEAGSGKVGGYLVRHAREFGAGRVVATASRDVPGADTVINHHDQDWPDQLDGIDVAFDMVGGETAGRVVAATRRSVLLYGTFSGKPPVLDAGVIMGQGLKIIGCGGPRWFQQCLGVHYPEFLDRAATRRSPLLPIDDILPLEAAAEAHRRVWNAKGRVLLTPLASNT